MSTDRPSPNDCMWDPHKFCGAWVGMRHRNLAFCGAWVGMRHRILTFCGAWTKDAPQKVENFCGAPASIVVWGRPTTAGLAPSGKSAMEKEVEAIEAAVRAKVAAAEKEEEEREK